MFSYKLFKQGNDVILAISDSQLIGKRFEENEMQLEVAEDFYAGEKCDKPDAKKLIRGATIINAVGHKIISLMIEENMIEKDKVLNIGGVPHAQIVSIEPEKS